MQLIGPVWPIVAYFYYYGRVVIVIHIHLVVVQTFLLRFLIDRVWKRPPPCRDEFFAIFVPAWNCFIGFLIAFMQLTTRERGPLIYRAVGKMALEWPKVKLNLHYDTMVFFLGFLSMFMYFVLRVSLYFKEKCRSRSTIAPAIPALVNALNGQSNPELAR